MINVRLPAASIIAVFALLFASDAQASRACPTGVRVVYHCEEWLPLAKKLIKRVKPVKSVEQKVERPVVRKVARKPNPALVQHYVKRVGTQVVHMCCVNNVWVVCQ